MPLVRMHARGPYAPGARVQRRYGLPAVGAAPVLQEEAEGPAVEDRVDRRDAQQPCVVELRHRDLEKSSWSLTLKLRNSHVLRCSIFEVHPVFQLTW